MTTTQTTDAPQTDQPKPTAGRPARIPDELVAEIRRRGSVPLKHGDQKVIAYDLGLSPSFVNQVLRGYRRKL